MPTQTLRELRRNSGMSIQEILNSVRTIAPEIAPQQRSGILNWENQGITDIRVIRALSRVYGVDLETVEAAALAAKDNFRTVKTDLLNSAI